MSAEAGSWFLVNASPDLPAQIEACPELQPRSHPRRNTPLAGVLLTNADLDHALGLFCLREGGRLNLWASWAVRNTLDDCLGLTAMLEAFCGTAWHEPPVAEFAPLAPAGSKSADLLCRAIDLGGAPPPFAKSGPPGLPAKAGVPAGSGARPPFAKSGPRGGRQSVAYQFMDRQTGGQLLVAPDVGGLNEALLEALSSSDAVLFDGTFWSGDELQGVKANAPEAGEMGHVTIQDCSLGLLGQLAARRKIYIHINNTNPVLAPDSPERAAVESAGLVVGCDGLEFEL